MPYSYKKSEIQKFCQNQVLKKSSLGKIKFIWKEGHKRVLWSHSPAEFQDLDTFSSYHMSHMRYEFCISDLNKQIDFSCWWLNRNVGDFLMFSVLNQSLTSQSCNQHISYPTSVVKILSRTNGFCFRQANYFRTRRTCSKSRNQDCSLFITDKNLY